jgi:N-acetylneuraminate synthase/N,N'-diacetyllegionaminate synthase
VTGRADGRVLFVVPARGGSRRTPRKNLLTVAGIPLVAWGVRLARRAAAAGDVVACSTDDPEIAAVAAAWGAVIVDRPAALATDTATSVDVALHALDEMAPSDGPFRALVLVQPTSPLTDPEDLRAALAAFDDGRDDAVVSISPSNVVGFGVRRGEHGRIDPSPATGAGHRLTGAFYVVGPETLRRERAFLVPGQTAGFIVPDERSVDVDEPADLAIAEALAAARPVRAFDLAGRAVGGGSVLVIAEVGVNHDGDPDLAHRLIDEAADAGADAVKFQTFDPAALAAAGAPTAAYQRASGAATDQRAMLARLALPLDAWPRLRDHVAARGLVFLSSPFDEASADLLADLGAPAFKVASGELTNLPFLERLAAVGRPLLVSTGMADMREVAVALDAIRAAGDPPVALFHCVSSYPADPADANLRAMATLRAAFGVPTGWSDHTPGVDMPIAAVALGAELLEKHVTLDRGRSGPDHAASLDPAQFRAMVAAVRATELALGNGVKRPVDAERDIAAVARRSLHWRHSLAAGAIVAEADLVALRPGTGLAPGLRPQLAGRRTVRDVAGGAMVADGDVEPAGG